MNIRMLQRMHCVVYLHTIFYVGFIHFVVYESTFCRYSHLCCGLSNISFLSYFVYVFYYYYK